MSSTGEGHDNESHQLHHQAITADSVAAQTLLALSQAMGQSNVPEQANDNESSDGHSQANQTHVTQAVGQDTQQDTMHPTSPEPNDNEDRHQPDATSGAPTAPQSWFHRLLNDRCLKLFLRYGLRCQQLDAEGERRIQQVLQSMPQRCCFQEAVWYLEENQWDINKAISQYNHDESQRAANGGDQWYQDALLRANSVAAATFDASDLVFNVRGVGGATFLLQFPESENFDVNDTYQLAALNQWRADLGRLLGDVPNIPPSQRTQTAWHTCEERLFRNRFAAKKAQYEAGGPPEYQNIVDMLNAYFVGRYYPGQIGPYRPRNFASAASMIDRKWKRSADRQRESANQAKVAAAERIEATRAEEQQEYDAWVV